jgi:hypothetical protein
MTLKEYCDVLRKNYGDSAAIQHVSQIAIGDNCVNVELLIERSYTREQLAVKIVDEYAAQRGMMTPSLVREYRERFLSPPSVPSGGEAPKAAPATEGGAACSHTLKCAKCGELMSVTTCV